MNSRRSVYPEEKRFRKKLYEKFYQKYVECTSFSQEVVCFLYMGVGLSLLLLLWTHIPLSLPNQIASCLASDITTRLENETYHPATIWRIEFRGRNAKNDVVFNGTVLELNKELKIEEKANSENWAMIVINALAFDFIKFDTEVYYFVPARAVWKDFLRARPQRVNNLIIGKRHPCIFQNPFFIPASTNSYHLLIPLLHQFLGPSVLQGHLYSTSHSMEINLSKLYLVNTITNFFRQLARNLAKLCTFFAMLFPLHLLSYLSYECLFLLSAKRPVPLKFHKIALRIGAIFIIWNGTWEVQSLMRINMEKIAFLILTLYHILFNFAHHTLLKKDICRKEIAVAYVFSYLFVGTYIAAYDNETHLAPLVTFVFGTVTFFVLYVNDIEAVDLIRERENNRMFDQSQNFFIQLNRHMLEREFGISLTTYQPLEVPSVEEIYNQVRELHGDIIPDPQPDPMGWIRNDPNEVFTLQNLSRNVLDVRRNIMHSNSLPIF